MATPRAPLKTTVAAGSSTRAPSLPISSLSRTVGPDFAGSRLATPAVVGGGGGLDNRGIATWTASSLVANTANGSFGGGLKNIGTMSMVFGHILNNTTPAGAGGGAGVSNTGTLTMDQVTISGNRSGVNGGGIDSRDPGDLTLTNVTISGNAAGTLVSTGRGGGLHNSSGLVDMRNVTIAENTAPSSAALVNLTLASALRLRRTIVANNHSTTGNDCLGQLTSLGLNVDRGNSCGFNPGGILLDLVNTDPLLGSLQSIGNGLLVHPLQPGSPAIDRGIRNADCPANDARGGVRPLDGNGDGFALCDVGAFEFDPVGVAAVSPSSAFVRSDQHQAYEIGWTVHAPQSWHDLRSIDFKLRDVGQTALWVRWDEATDTFALVDPDSGRPGTGVRPGEQYGARTLAAPC